MSKLFRSTAAVLCAAVAWCSAAQAQSLKIGDAAPALEVGKYVKGEPVKSFEKGKLYVVEFWATWCPPCRTSIPHLTDMQKAMPDVTFIGVDVGEDEATVAPFVEKMGDKMEYRVVLDDSGKANSAFMEAAGQKGIPTAFIVDKESKLAWIGHPMEMEPVLKEIAAGTYDPKKAIAANEVKNKLMAALQNSDFDTALKLADEAAAANPAMADQWGLMQFQVLLMVKKDTAAAIAKADELSGKLQDPMTMNQLAWMLVTLPNADAKTLDIAQKIADKGVTASKEDPQIIDTLARVYACKKDFPKAVELQTKAVEKSDSESKAALQKTLDAYKKNEVPAAE